ncbi:MFS transporter [Streptomyces sp. NEAU-H22]|uniref:MFS transporter n=1 Tax=unclassified Streptomyces TaxID=2593676 RepID=UPI00224EE2CA|nr:MULTISPECIES: MFS transporter [unclassified Streptomyces]MCX3287667.1 MFS transporter [Streptomyces sp. NEAU-H22]WMD05006.1 MFS transporter [Streptomyces sp. FXY-T5]
MTTPATIRPRALVRACGGPRYAVALAVDALGTGLLRPFLLLYGVLVLRLSAHVTGIAMTAGIVAGLVCMPAVGRWLDRGARSTVVAASMLVRVLGVALLLATPAGHAWPFATAALFLGIGNQAWPAAHAALMATVSQGRERDAALAAGRALRNAGLGVGALIATVCLAGGATALQALAAVTGLASLAAAALAWSVRLRVHPAAAPDGGGDGGGGPAPRMSALLAANVVYVFCLNVPEIALPLILVTQLDASPVWSAAVFMINTVMVVTLQVPVTVLMSRYSRRSVLALAGVILGASYAGFLAAASLGPGRGAPAVAAVSVLCTLGEIVYAGSATALVTHLAPAHALGRTLARFELSTGFGLAVSPTVITALAPYGPTALWGSLATATLLSASAVATAPVARDTPRG